MPHSIHRCPAVPRSLSALLLFALAALPALAKDSALGTLTVRGKTSQLNQVYAEKQHDAEEASDEYLVVLLADRAVAPADRHPGRLLSLARDGQLKALRVTLRLGYDDLRVAPYDAGLNESGLATKGLAMIDLSALDDSRVEATVSSKPLGQEWHFNVKFKAALNPGGVVKAEEGAGGSARQRLDAREGGRQGGDAPHPAQVPDRPARLRLQRRGHDAGGLGRRPRSRRSLPPGGHVPRHRGEQRHRAPDVLGDVLHAGSGREEGGPRAQADRRQGEGQRQGQQRLDASPVGGAELPRGAASRP